MFASDLNIIHKDGSTLAGNTFSNREPWNQLVLAMIVFFKDAVDDGFARALYGLYLKPFLLGLLKGGGSKKMDGWIKGCSLVEFFDK